MPRFAIYISVDKDYCYTCYSYKLALARFFLIMNNAPPSVAVAIMDNGELLFTANGSKPS